MMVTPRCLARFRFLMFSFWQVGFLEGGVCFAMPHLSLASCRRGPQNRRAIRDLPRRLKSFPSVCPMTHFGATLSVSASELFQRERKWKWQSLSCVQLLVTRELHSPWNSPGQSTGVDSLFLLQGIFPTQGSNPGLPHCRLFLYQLSHKGSPRLLEWVAYPFSSGSSWPRNQTRVSCMAGGFFTNWTIREAPRWIFFISR